jgi:hypothetical protein
VPVLALRRDHTGTRADPAIWKLDWDYLRGRGKEERVLALLEELEEQARHGQD